MGLEEEHSVRGLLLGLPCRLNVDLRLFVFVWNLQSSEVSVKIKSWHFGNHLFVLVLSFNGLNTQLRLKWSMLLWRASSAGRPFSTQNTAEHCISWSTFFLQSFDSTDDLLWCIIIQCIPKIHLFSIIVDREEIIRIEGMQCVSHFWYCWEQHKFSLFSSFGTNWSISQTPRSAENQLALYLKSLDWLCLLVLHTNN